MLACGVGVAVLVFVVADTAASFDPSAVGFWVGFVGQHDGSVECVGCWISQQVD